MALLDRLRGLFGGEDDAGSGAHPDDLLALPGAAMAAEAEAGFAPTGEAALCFGASEEASFDETIADLEGVLDATEAEAGTAVDFREGDHGYRWLVLADDEVTDLATTLQFAAETFTERAFGDRLLAALVAFESTGGRGDDDGQLAYLIYSFQLGRYYPFVPEGSDERDLATEFRLQRTFDEEVHVEGDRSEWYPLWPDRAGEHPWE